MKHIITLFLCILFPFLLCAQNKNEMEREILEYKIKYLAQEMELKPEQQKKFVELYTKMSGEKRKAFEAAMGSEKRVRREKNASSADYQRATDAMAQAKIEEGNIDKRYDAEFKKFLSSKQIYKMKEAEKTFRKKMKELRNKRKK